MIEPVRPIPTTYDSDLFPAVSWLSLSPRTQQVVGRAPNFLTHCVGLKFSDWAGVVYLALECLAVSLSLSKVRQHTSSATTHILNPHVFLVWVNNQWVLLQQGQMQMPTHKHRPLFLVWVNQLNGGFQQSAFTLPGLLYIFCSASLRRKYGFWLAETALFRAD